MTFMKSLTALPVLLAVLISGCSDKPDTATETSSANKPGAGVSVKGFHSPIAEEKFQTLVINRALAELGYDVQPILEVEYNAGYTAIAQNDIQWAAISWDPLHNEMFKNSGGNDKIIRLGKYITGAAQGYLMDKATAEKYNIDTIDDLKDPKLAKLFDSTGDGKADLTGCQPGWGCEAVINHQLDAFELRDTVNHVQGSYAAIISDTIARYKAGQSIVYYTWTPYWVSGVLIPGQDVIWLQVPRSAHPQGTDTQLANGDNYGFNVNSERVVVNKAFADANPAAKKLFEVAKLNINAISAENKLIADGENTLADIERHTTNWIENNQKLFDSWLEAARNAAM
jgi:glycine betaine/proline transport system substrate-binding protein